MGGSTSVVGREWSRKASSDSLAVMTGSGSQFGWTGNAPKSSGGPTSAPRSAAPAPSAGDQGSAVGRLRDGGTARRPGGKPAGRPLAAAGQLPSAVRARLRQARVLHTAPARAAHAGERGDVAARTARGRCLT